MRGRIRRPQTTLSLRRTEALLRAGHGQREALRELPALGHFD